ncbi:hypothetical protein M1534_02470 [Patescibacteria group bacterium]|jgi:hypothetical protein|nr:hypothetical protein [Patescibacteria group bacterium]
MAVPEEKLYRGVIQEWAAQYDRFIGAVAARDLADNLSDELEQATQAQQEAALEYADAVKAFRATLIAETTNRVSLNMERSIGDLRQHFLVALNALELVPAAQELGDNVLITIAKMVTGASATQPPQPVLPRGGGKAGKNAGKRRHR